MDLPYAFWILVFMGFYALIKLYNIATRNTTYARMVDQVNGPYSMPLLGNAWDLFVKREDIFMNLIRLLEGHAHEGMVRFWIGPEAYVVLTRAPQIETIVTSNKHITKSEDYTFFHSWLGMGLLTSTGEKWQRRRKMLTPSFHFRILDDFITVFNEQSQVFVEILREKAKTGEKFDIYPYVTRCALDIIIESTMGTNVQAQRVVDSPYVKAVYGMGGIVLLRIVRPWLKPAFLFNLTSHRRDEKDYLKTLHTFSKKVIQERKQILKDRKAEKPLEESEEVIFGTKKRLAFLDLMLEASNEDGKGLTDDEIREEVDTFMFEGHDTTSANVSWTLYLLGRYPEIQKKVQDELDEVLGFGSDRPMISADLSKLKYLEAVMKESLRIYPSVPIFGRMLKENAVIGGLTIPAETTVFVGVYFANRDPEVFPDPDRFDPDRFMGDANVGRNPFAYIPFSAGPRNCIGQKFAIADVKVILADVLRNFDIVAYDDPKDIIFVAEPILRPVDGLTVSLKERRFD